MPQTFPDGVESGVLKSPCASNHAIARRPPGPAARKPAIAPACAVQSPPMMNSRAASARDRVRNHVPLPRQELADQVPILGSRIRVGHETRVDREITGVTKLDAAQARPLRDSGN